MAIDLPLPVLLPLPSRYPPSARFHRYHPFRPNRADTDKRAHPCRDPARGTGVIGGVSIRVHFKTIRVGGNRRTAAIINEMRRGEIELLGRAEPILRCAQREGRRAVEGD